MATPGFGSKSYIEFAPETAYAVGGTTALYQMEVISMNVDPVQAVIPDPSLYNAQSRRALYQGALYYKGKFAVRLNYDDGSHDGLMELFRGVSGTYAAPALVGGETVVYDHLFTEGQTLRTYRIQMIEGNIPSTKCQVLVGAKITEVVVKGNAGTGTDAMLVAEFTVIARDKLTNQTPTGALAFTTTLPVIFNQAYTFVDMAGMTPGLIVLQQVTCGGSTGVTFGPGITTYGIQVGMTVTWSGGTTNTVLAVPTSTTVTLTANGPTQTNLPATFSYPDRPRSFEFSLINPHHEDRFYLGGLNPDEPLRSDFLEAKWRITKEFVNINDIAGLQAWTVSTPSILFRNQGQPIGTASYREFEIRSNTAQVTSVGTPVQGYGIILLTTEHTAYRDSTTDLSAFRIRFRTTLTTALP